MAHRPLMAVSLGFAGGIWLSHVFLPAGTGSALLFAGLASGSLMVFLFLNRVRPWALLFCFFCLGAVSDSAHHPVSRLSPLAQARNQVTMEGVVLNPAVLRQETGRIDVRVQQVYWNNHRGSVDEKVRVAVYKECPDLQPGDRIRFPARLRQFRNFHNPGRFDYQETMKLKSFTCGASLSDGRRIVVMGSGPLPFPQNILEKARGPVRRFLNDHLHPQNAALFSALILGERGGITPEMRERFNQSGLGHVLAVSGLHIGLVAAMSFFLFTWGFNRSYRLMLRLDTRMAAAVLTAVPVVGYTALAGFQVSGQRAMVMVLAFLASFTLRREKEVWSTLAAAALAILAIDPHALFSTSFHLSFAAVVGILLLVPPILERVTGSSYESRLSGAGPLRRVTGYFLGLVTVSFGAAVFLLPLSALYFHRIPLITLIANVTVVPVLGLWVVPSGLLSAALLPFSEPAAAASLHLSRWGLDAMVALTRFYAQLPFASVWVVTPNLLELVLFYGLLFLILTYRRIRWAKAGLILVLLIASVDVAYWVHRVGFHKDLRVTFLDVGQGHAALVEFPKGKRMLIDGGGFPWSDFDVGRMVVAPFLWHSKISRIDYLVLSHPHPDHLHGLPFIARTFDPDEFWHNGVTVPTEPFNRLQDTLRTQGTRILPPRSIMSGREINGATVSVLHPRAVPHGGKQLPKGLNNQSLVLRISYRGTSFLLPGDLERPGEQALLARSGDRLKSDVLLCPHHGSRTSSTNAFLRKVAPRVCVISAGANNLYGFPHGEVLDRLQRLSCRTLRTDRHGAVTCTVDGEGLRVSTFLGDG